MLSLSPLNERRKFDEIYYSDEEENDAMDGGSGGMNLNLRECEDLIRASIPKKKLIKHSITKTQPFKGRQLRSLKRQIQSLNNTVMEN
jgi:hypothetical protein